MDHQKVAEIINNVFESTCVEVFERFKCKIDTRADLDVDLQSIPTANIGAKNNEFEVGVYLHMPEDLLSETYPLRFVVDSVAQEELHDWISEVSNRLLGNLKTKLFMHGCRMKMTLPQYYNGTDEIEDHEGQDKTTRFKYTVAGYPLIVDLYLIFSSDDITFSEEATPIDTGVINDGDIEYL